MTYINLSEIGKTYVIYIDLPEGLEYYTDDGNWVGDIDQAQRFGSGKAENYLAKLGRRGTVAKLKAVPGVYQIQRWVDIGWVVINTASPYMTVHRIRLIGDDLNGFLRPTIKELTLRAEKNSEAYWLIRSDGHEIRDVEYNDHTTLTQCDSFLIHDDSNLRYMFEFEATPIETLEP